MIELPLAVLTLPFGFLPLAELEGPRAAEWPFEGSESRKSGSLSGSRSLRSGGSTDCLPAIRDQTP